MSIVLRLLTLLAAILAVPAAAQDRWVVVEEWVLVEESSTASRYVSPLQEQAANRALAVFGPFRVIDEKTAAIVDITSTSAPQHFGAMLEAFPGIAVLEFVEAPGTHDDRANLRLGRMIRQAGIATRVSAGGSVRSGAVELFLAGTRREIAPAAEFAVHGWLDDWGRGAEDYAPQAPEHRRYLDYYVEMGMSMTEAQAFYAMTNSVPFESARWLTGREMLGWMASDGAQTAQIADAAQAAPALVYLDLELALQ